MVNSVGSFERSFNGSGAERVCRVTVHPFASCVQQERSIGAMLRMTALQGLAPVFA